MGRTTKYTDELGLEICSQIAHGKSLVSICKQEGMPSVVSVYSWLNDERYKLFLNNYTRAREDQADTLADEIIDIADEASTTVKAQDGLTEVVFDSTAVARNRLRVESRKWVASKLKPKKYGDKIQQELSGDINVGFHEILAKARERAKGE